MNRRVISMRPRLITVDLLVQVWLPVSSMDPSCIVRLEENILISWSLFALWTVLFTVGPRYYVLDMLAWQLNIVLTRQAHVLSSLYLEWILIFPSGHFSNADGCTAENLKNSQWWGFSSTFDERIGALAHTFASIIEELLHPLWGLWRSYLVWA